MAERLVAGLDLGSTGIKVLVADEAGREVLVEQARTPWRSGPGGTAELDAAALLQALKDLLGRASARLAQTGAGPVQAVAVSGMGETGMLVDKE